MSIEDTKIVEKDEDELIVVETPPAEEPDDKPEAEEDDGDEDEGDTRVAESDDDLEEDIAAGSANRDRRKKRREMQRKAKEAAQRELDMLRRQNAELMGRVSAIEGHVVQTNERTLEQRLDAAIREVRQAENIIAKATDAGNGEDVVAAMRIRDAAIANAQQLQSTKQQLEAAKQQPANSVPPQVATYAQQWLQANPWYDPSARDADSRVAKEIDSQMAREGFNPADRGYWEELTRRVATAFEGTNDAAPETKKRKAPPTGNTREHAPVSTKREIYVTPERKQAMIDAGVWEDPAARQRYLKAYQAYDKDTAR